MILVRLDPNQPDTTMLSVPRDLKVTIHPDHGTADHAEDQRGLLDRRREARRQDDQAGARDQDQPRDRHQLRRLQDARRLPRAASTSRSTGATTTRTSASRPSQTYDEINIQPGYQKLCGDDALHYVRYRHTDTDLVRSARQQDFLRQIKNQIGAGGLIARRYRDREDLRQVLEHRHPLERRRAEAARADRAVGEPSGPAGHLQARPSAPPT